MTNYFTGELLSEKIRKEGSVAVDEAIEIYKKPDMIDSAPKCIVNGDCEIIYKYVGCGELVVNVDWVEENYFRRYGRDSHELRFAK